MKGELQQLQENINQYIIGQEELVESLIIGLIADGNLLLEGLPGLAKTRAVKALSKSLNIAMNRIQFTPDLLPSDITGTEIYNPEGKETFEFKPGPIFSNLILADEINRAPAKVQSALLEAMEERQVTVAGKTYKMDPLFLVIATQNPVEQEGTYPLPEAQMDRFLMKVDLGYLSTDQEEDMLKLVRSEAKRKDENKPVETSSDLQPDFIYEFRKKLDDIEVSEAINKYIVRIIEGTRNPEKYKEELAQYIEYGGSPRATISLDKAARTVALMKGKDYVDVDDVRAIAHRVLRHRLILSYQANADKKTADMIITDLLNAIPVN